MFDEAEKSLNDYHSGACGGHMFGYTTAQKILRAGYFWPSLFNDCILSSKNAMLARPKTIKYGHTLLLFILWYPLALLQNGVSIS
jgi:hypothetical protein